MEDAGKTAGAHASVVAGCRQSELTRVQFSCCVMETFSREIVGWSIDSVRNSSVVVNALDMAIENRRPAASSNVPAATALRSPRGRSGRRSAPPG